MGKVNESFINSLEPRLNTFYRMVGLPVSGTNNIISTSSGTKVSQSSSAKSVKDLVDSITARRTEENENRINRGIVGVSTGKNGRFRFPVVDGLIEIPVGKRVIDPFINTAIAIRLNKYDAPELGSPPEASQELALMENKIKRNIDRLVDLFPRYLVKQIQKDARYRTISDKRNNKDDPDGEGQLKANNGTFGIESVNPKGEVVRIEMRESDLNSVRSVLKEEVETENVLLALLPLSDIRANKFSSSLLNMINHNSLFLNKLSSQIKEKTETINTEQRKRERALLLIEGIEPLVLEDAQNLNTSKRLQLSNAISALEILAVFSALFEIDEDTLLTLA
ncbi:MAG: hypothetical protein R3321_14950, partial [Nitrososphaeraceae archaeon]|nr:hypothetical protein [Nitrososphaeraceae archaeon]